MHRWEEDEGAEEVGAEEVGAEEVEDAETQSPEDLGVGVGRPVFGELTMGPVAPW